MPPLPPRHVASDNFDALDQGISWVAEGPTEEIPADEGLVEASRISYRGGLYTYDRSGGYPVHYPADRHLITFIWNYIPPGSDGDDSSLPEQRRRLQGAILAGRDSMRGTCPYSYASFPTGFARQPQFPDSRWLGFYQDLDAAVVRSTPYSPAVWHLAGHHKAVDVVVDGVFLTPYGGHFAHDGYDHLCMLEGILSLKVPSWYGSWSVLPSHCFHRGAGEWLWGILTAHSDTLDRAGIRHAVTVALYSYPCHIGLLQAIVERWNRRWNTLVTAEGETTLDLWSFHRISGLSISGQAYEELCLDDAHLYSSDGTGHYLLPYCFHYLMKTLRDLALVGKEKTVRTPRVTLNA